MPALPTGLVGHTNGTCYLLRRIPADLLSVYPPNKTEEYEPLGVRTYLHIRAPVDRRGGMRYQRVSYLEMVP